MTLWLIKNDWNSNKNLNIILLVLLLTLSLLGWFLIFIAMNIASDSSYSDLSIIYDLSAAFGELVFSLFFIFTFIIGSFAVYLLIYKSVKKDVKLGFYVLGKTKNLGNYLVYKYFYNIFIIFIIFSIVYFINGFMISIFDAMDFSNLQNWIYFYYFLTIAYFIYTFKLMLIGFIILGTVFLFKYTKISSAITYLVLGWIYYMIELFFWNANSIILLCIRSGMVLVILAYICGCVLERNMELT